MHFGYYYQLPMCMLSKNIDDILINAWNSTFRNVNII